MPRQSVVGVFGLLGVCVRFGGSGCSVSCSAAVWPAEPSLVFVVGPVPAEVLMWCRSVWPSASVLCVGLGWPSLAAALGWPVVSVSSGVVAPLGRSGWVVRPCRWS